MKKIFCFAAAFVIAFTLTSCKTAENEDDASSAVETHSVSSETVIPTSVSKMNRNIYKPQFLGLPISTIKTRDKVSRYGTENDFDYSDKPAFKKRGKALTVAIFASVPKMY